MSRDNPALIERLSEIAKTCESLGHGEKSVYLAQKAQELDMSVSTLYRKLEKVAIKPVRKARIDKGMMSLTLDEARLISSVVMEGMRKNGKRIMTVERAITMLRANSMITACDEMGNQLSTGTVVRSLKAYNLHPDQLNEPAPVVSMKSLHPNHLWQIDPSLCVLYYLPRMGKDSGLRVASYDEFYKNKPANVVKIINDRVWRYVGTDHTSGAVYCHYYFGGETSANLCDFFIRMMSPKADTHKDPIRGVPKMVMLDPGSANTSSAFKTLCQALEVQVQINKPKNPRAKGQVEKANDIVETQFESGLKFVKVNDIDILNALCDKWLRYFNSQIIHSRHGMTRYQAWNKIKSDELVNAPPSFMADLGSVERICGKTEPQSSWADAHHTLLAGIGSSAINLNCADIIAVPNGRGQMAVRERTTVDDGLCKGLDETNATEARAAGNAVKSASRTVYRKPFDDSF